MTLRWFVLGSMMLAGLAWAAADDPVSTDMATRATRLLLALDQEQAARATIGFSDDERYNFHYIPRERKGLPFTAMTPAQRKLTHAFLATGLSHHGVGRALDIMYLDQILFEAEGRAIRDPDAYYVTVFGEPGDGAEWGWRVEGHHLSLNFTLREGRVVSSFPSFMGANPANVLSGPQRGMRVLAEEELFGRALLRSFDERGAAIIEAEAPNDIVTASNRRVDLESREGIAVSSMTAAQKTALEKLIGLYAHRLRPELAEEELRKISSAGFDEVYFAWAGGVDEGEPHYYRIHGPTFLIEYDNTQNDANHIHTVWRDPTGDWGDPDPLSDHYARASHHQLALAHSEVAHEPVAPSDEIPDILRGALNELLGQPAVVDSLHAPTVRADEVVPQEERIVERAPH